MTPTRAAVEDVARRTAAGMRSPPRNGPYLRVGGDDAPPPELTLNPPGLAACYAAAAQGSSVSGARAGLPALRLVLSQEPPPLGTDMGTLADEPVAEVRRIVVACLEVANGERPPGMCRRRLPSPRSRARSEPSGSSSIFDLRIQAVTRIGHPAATTVM